MRKHIRTLALIGVVTLMLGIMTASALATTSVPVIPAPASAPAVTAAYGCNAQGQQACYTLMWNEDGSFASRDVFSERYDTAVADGYFRAEDKDYFLSMYDNCAVRIQSGRCGRTNGGGGRGMGGGRCGRR